MIRNAVYVAASAMLAVPAAAATTTYSDPGAFAAATGASTIVTFQGCPNGAGGTVISSVSGPCSGIAAGVTFSASDFYIAAPGQSTNPTTALGIDTPPGGVNAITVSGGTSFFGLDLFQNFAGGSQRTTPVNYAISVFGAGNVLLGNFNPLVAPNGGSFFGLTSTDTIFAVNVSLPSGFAVIDNFRFSTTNAVPEPGTWALLIVGFGVVGSSLRGRHRLNRAVRPTYA